MGCKVSFLHCLCYRILYAIIRIVVECKVMDMCAVIEVDVTPTYIIISLSAEQLLCIHNSSGFRYPVLTDSL